MVVEQPRDEVIVSLYRAGVPVADIATRSGVCVKTVRNVARRMGLPPRHAPQPGRDAAVADRYRTGDLVHEIAADHGISRSRVRVIAAKAGIPPRSGWQRRYPIDESVFDVPTAVGWWLIGLLAADGSIHAAENRVSLCQTLADSDVLRAFLDYVGCPDRPLTMLNLSDEARSRQLPRRPAAEARIFSKRIVEALARHGIVPRKTATMKLSAEASRQPAVWLGLLDGDGSVGIYRNGRAPRLMFSGTRELMEQCQDFWRDALDLAGPRPAARPHARGIWTFTLWGHNAATAADLLLRASPTSMRRKRDLLLHIAGRNEESACASPQKKQS
jgi:lambda repressor-like predicted transcriptional regulator